MDIRTVISVLALGEAGLQACQPIFNMRGENKHLEQFREKKKKHV